ncbi:Protein of unknown function [Pyronema omphalodes CBS 100304]|uniref:Uncharacterized protein n=1 Tax=Pyronema omphalodes (strain CBS 100304) TaxID=1076935 RepID=U4L4Y2_PYROM|nr:Protein of unknown function [Pyronema omphalodes CBS 100304]
MSDINSDTDANTNTDTNTNIGTTTNTNTITSTDTNANTETNTITETNTNTTEANTNADANTTTNTLPPMLNGAFVERDIPNGTVVNGFAMDGMTLSGVVTDGIIMNGNYSDIEDAYNHGNVTIAGVPDFETEQEMAFWIIQRSRRLLDAKCEIVRLQISRQYPHWIASIAKAHNILSEGE